MGLHKSVRECNFDGVRDAIQAGVPVNQLDDHGFTPLAYAVSNKDVALDILKILVESGADVNVAVTNYQRYPLQLAASSGSTPKVQVLLDGGANILYESEGGYTIIVDTVYGLYNSDDLVPMIEFLHRNNASIDAETEHGESPLSVASCFGRFDAVKCLLDLGADETPLNWTELMMTLVWGTVAKFESALDQTCLINHQDRFERTAFHLCAFGPYLEKAKLLHNLGVDISGGSGWRYCHNDLC